MKTNVASIKSDMYQEHPFTVELLKQHTYLIGVSGGPDSMALFDMCRRQHITLVAVHMNYQKRDTAQRDEEIVRNYCLKYGIPFEVRWQNKECKGNFQAFARKERYHFYQEMSERYHAEGVLLAHHLDDHLETYLMQKQRGSIGEYYGIKAQTIIHGCQILRPLLSYTKQELLTYCMEHGVPYGMDESNFTNEYTRNQIRHDVIEHMNANEKAEMERAIKDANQKRLEFQKQCREFLEHWNYEEEVLLTLDEQMLEQVLSTWIYETCKIRISHKECSLLSKLIHQKSKQWTRDIKGAYSIYNEYGYLCIDERKEIAYTHTFHFICYMKTEYFAIQDSGSPFEALTLFEQDFPITIRNVHEGDVISMRYGKKKINRWFIDHKIPRKLRKKWPVVENAAGNIILVPEIGCDIEHFSNNPNIFVVK